MKQAKCLILHSGDCSIYRLNCDVCDCGALRSKISSGEITEGDDDIWVIWYKHLEALERSKYKFSIFNNV